MLFIIRSYNYTRRVDLWASNVYKKTKYLENSELISNDVFPLQLFKFSQLLNYQMENTT